MDERLEIAHDELAVISRLEGKIATEEEKLRKDYLAITSLADEAILEAEREVAAVKVSSMHKCECKECTPNFARRGGQSRHRQIVKRGVGKGPSCEFPM